MRRFLALFVLLLCAVPFGVSVSGCSKKTAPTFCNGGDSGIIVGQATTITLQPVVTGISLNYSEIGQLSSPSATDCKGNSASVGSYTYGSTDMTIADVDPSTGRLCGGTWNRHSGGGIADYTVCIPTNKSGTAYVSASASGVTSNPIPIFIHAVVTSIVLGAPSTNCTSDPATNCSPAAYTYSLPSTSAGACPTSATFPNNPQLANGCCAIPPATVAPPSSSLLPYNANSCFSQNKTTQLSARIFAGTGSSQTNISCLAGHLQYSAEGATSSTSISPVVSIDQNGIATANQPGSVLISANVSNAASSAGFFSTCPPASITLSSPGATTNPIVVNQNNQQPLVATAVDTQGATLTGLTLQYVSTSPSTIPASSTLTPALAGAADIFAICEPPTCNSSPYSQIGLFGNGKPVISNPVSITSPGTNGTVLFMASTQSRYVVAQDFTRTGATAPLLLPYAPNSMVITTDGSTIYMGSSSALMVLNAVSSLAITRVDTTSPGTVLAVSPDGTLVVISDPTRQVISIENSSGAVVSTYGGVGTHAQFSPDNQAVYITAGSQLLVYSTFTGWTSITPSTPASDVAVTVPSVGAYFAGAVTTARSYCASTTINGNGTTTNDFYSLADSQPAVTDRLAATNDGQHILGATTISGPVLSDLRVNIPVGACPANGGLTFPSTLSTSVLSQINATAITGIWPAPDSSIAFVTYNGTGGVIPAYAPASSGSGQLTYVKLSGSATAPLSGAVSADNSTFYTGTAGDNLVHIINRSTLTDSSTLTPNLTGASGNAVPVDLLVQKPRKTT
ncbi:MAG TPA: hypothetical protein VHU44_02660 [Acidobacteriaceae bacterium]|jgi:hypothetical protein|nr:hypothetical protein [Acidobacteriaceae bacterium]